MMPNLFIPKDSIQFEIFVGEADVTDQDPVAGAGLVVGCGEQEEVLAVDVELIVGKREAHGAVLEGLQLGVRVGRRLLPGEGEEGDGETAAHL